MNNIALMQQPAWFRENIC